MSGAESRGDVRLWLRDAKHLPTPLRDFHDQKDVFKALHDWLEKAESERDGLHEMPTWVAGQIYVIDYFLRFMAFHGWTLQRSRAPIAFGSLSETIAEREKRELERFHAMFAKEAGSVEAQRQTASTAETTGATE